MGLINYVIECGSGIKIEIEVVEIPPDKGIRELPPGRIEFWYQESPTVSLMMYVPDFPLIPIDLPPTKSISLSKYTCRGDSWYRCGYVPELDEWVMSRID